MNLNETLQIMAVLRSEYADFCRGFSDKEMERKAALWQDLFADDDAVLVAAAVKSIISSDQREFSPKVSHIKEEMRKLTSKDELDAAGAWTMVRKAVGNSCYESGKEFAALPENVRRIVGSASQLRDWALMDSGTLNSVVASNFQRAYRTRQEGQHREAMLPPEVRDLVEQLSGEKQMDALPEKKPEDSPAAIGPGTGRSRAEMLTALTGGGKE